MQQFLLKPITVHKLLINFKVVHNMPGMNGVEEEGSGSDYSMEGAGSGADETIDEGFANMIEASLRGKSVDGQISIDEIDEETVLSSSVLVELDHRKRYRNIRKICPTPLTEYEI